MDQAAPSADNLVDLLDQLQDIVEPAPVSLLPATAAWAVLGAVLLALLALGLRRWLRQRRATRYRRAALATLKALEPALAAGDARALWHLDELIRRTALAAFPRREVAALTGPAWIEFLERTGGAGGFAGLQDALLAAPYAPGPLAFDGPALARAARQWISRQHA
jgi:hypothetical protein